MPDRPYTSKQMGDACEMMVAAEMTLAGVPALKVPSYMVRFSFELSAFSGRILTRAR